MSTHWWHYRTPKYLSIQNTATQKTSSNLSKRNNNYSTRTEYNEAMINSRTYTKQSKWYPNRHQSTTMIRSLISRSSNSSRRQTTTRKLLSTDHDRHRKPRFYAMVCVYIPSYETKQRTERHIHHKLPHRTI